jgi:asparagine synthase (glutamine-hydrolysing)
MCGIAGIFYREGRRPVDLAVLRRMGDAIAHRGPDAEGFWTGAESGVEAGVGVGLAHRRLSIIDLAGGRQPMGNEDDSLQVVFNGEIYNYRELRRELEGRGHRFQSESDTEILVHLYEEQGEGLVDRLRGMFAFALWDVRKQSLLLARDRVGIKPLYVYRDGEKVLFGSEIKALLAYGDIERRLDLAALEAYVTFGVVPGGRSIFQKIGKLSPGHVLRIDRDNWERGPRRYWQLQFEPDESMTAEAWCEAVEAKVAESVEAHRIADVPVGAFLSGGLDSSAVLAMLANGGGPAVQTFSIGFEEKEFSELPYARQVAKQFGTTHVEQIVTPEAVGSLTDLVRYYDEPFADASAIPTLWVSRLAARHVKVVLSGDGGDEAFGGYRRYAHDLREAALRNWIPTWARHGLLGPLGRAWPKADWLPRVLRGKTLLTNLALEPAAAYANTLALCRWPERRRLLTGDVWAELNGTRPEQQVTRAFGDANDDPLRGMLAADVAMYLPDDFLTKVDRASMSCGLEVRPPLVDHELLELAARIPSRFKVRGGTTKWILKEAFRKRLPGEIIDRPKQGFEIPIDNWLRGPLREIFEAKVLSPNNRLGTYIDQREAGRLYGAHQSRVGRHGILLWGLLVLGCWMDEYLREPSLVSNSRGEPIASSVARN